VRLDQIKLNIGKVTISPTIVKVGDPVVWSIIFAVGDIPLKESAEIRFTIPEVFINPQSKDPYDVGYTTVKCSNPQVSLTILEKESWCPAYDFDHNFMEGVVVAIAKDKEKRIWSPIGTNLFVKIRKGTLLQGQTVTLTYGDLGGSGPGGQVGISRQKVRAPVYVGVDPTGNREAPHNGFYLVPDYPWVGIEPDLPRILKAVIPSTILNSSVFMGVFAYDGHFLGQKREGEAQGVSKPAACPCRYGRALTEYKAQIEYNIDSISHQAVIDHQNPDNRGINLSLQPPQTPDHFHTITVVDTTHTLIAKSNPTINPRTWNLRFNLYWGDPHIMNGAFWATPGLTPADHYRYARDTVGLDFAMVTDICREPSIFDTDVKMSLREWEGAKNTAKEFYQPGSFVTFPAYEYNERRHGGDRNVYYIDEQEAELFCWDDPRYDTPEKLWQALKGKKVMTIPHHSVTLRIGQNWDHHDPQFQRLVEIYSEWGCSERGGCRRAFNIPSDYGNRSVQAALARGYRLGFVAGSDTHSGEVGGPAKTGVWATKLDRESLWEALWERRCYATTGERIILGFWINGAFMGSEIEGHPLERHLIIKALGTAPIRIIEVVRNNVTIYRHKGSNVLEEVEYVDRENCRQLPLFPHLYYYVRVIQSDSEMAWGSPIWLGKSDARDKN
jgi:hypothetical protein